MTQSPWIHHSDASIGMTTVSGDGSSEAGGGFMGKLLNVAYTLR